MPFSFCAVAISTIVQGFDRKTIIHYHYHYHYHYRYYSKCCKCIAPHEESGHRTSFSPARKIFAFTGNFCPTINTISIFDGCFETRLRDKASVVHRSEKAFAKRKDERQLVQTYWSPVLYPASIVDNITTQMKTSWNIFLDVEDVQTSWLPLSLLILLS